MKCLRYTNFIYEYGIVEKNYEILYNINILEN